MTRHVVSAEGVSLRSFQGVKKDHWQGALPPFHMEARRAAPAIHKNSAKVGQAETFLPVRSRRFPDRLARRGGVTVMKYRTRATSAIGRSRRRTVIKELSRGIYFAVTYNGVAGATHRRGETGHTGTFPTGIFGTASPAVSVSFLLPLCCSSQGQARTETDGCDTVKERTDRGTQ